MGTGKNPRRPRRPGLKSKGRPGKPAEYYVDAKQEAERQKHEKALYPQARDELQRKMYLTPKQKLTDREKTFGTFKVGEPGKRYRYYARVRILYKNTAVWLDLYLGPHGPKEAREKAATILSSKLKDLVEVGYVKSLKSIIRISIEAAFRRKDPEVRRRRRKNEPGDWGVWL